jgi:hypothetical protein
MDLGRMIEVHFSLLSGLVLLKINIALVEILLILCELIKDPVDFLREDLLTNAALHALCELKRLDRISNIHPVHLLHNYVSDCIKDLGLCKATALADNGLG